MYRVTELGTNPKLRVSDAMIMIMMTCSNSKQFDTIVNSQHHIKQCLCYESGGRYIESLVV